MNIEKYIELYSRDLNLKNYSKNTIDNYKSQVNCFLNYFKCVANKPTEISEEKIKDWLLKTNSINARKHRLSALKLFYKVTISQPFKFKNIEYPRADKKLPIVLSVQEIKNMFLSCNNLKHKAVLAVLYSCGLRISEVINLKWEHIDRSNGIINIIQAKGRKDRQVPLSNDLIKILTDYYYQYKSKEYVFNGQFDLKYSEKSINEVLKSLAIKSGIKKKVHAHLIRHSHATHLLECGTDISIIQKILGHNSPKTTQIYTHISSQLLNRTTSLLQSVI